MADDLVRVAFAGAIAQLLEAPDCPAELGSARDDQLAKPGKREIAQIELVASPPPSSVSLCDAEIFVLLHEGHQVVAKQFRADLALPPALFEVDKLK